MALDKARIGYKPFEYPWAYEAWKTQQQIHWLPDEVPLGEDVKEWGSSLTEAERHLVTQIFRFFTQSDIEVNDCYHRHYLSIFKPTEIVMMLTAFSNMETIHIDAYSHLISTLGLPDVEYSKFLDYKAMKDKHDFMQSFDVKDPLSVATTLAGFGAFTEGMALFASFAILLNFPRHGKMKGMGQIITWSVRDETLHCNNVVRLYHEWLNEHPEIDQAALEKSIIEIAEKAVSHEDAFIDLAFEMGAIEGLSAEEVKAYIRYIANIRLCELGLDYRFAASDKNPLPWLDVLLNAQEHANFFESRATEYSRGTTGGDWGDVWNEQDNMVKGKAA